MTTRTVNLVKYHDTKHWQMEWYDERHQRHLTSTRTANRRQAERIAAAFERDELDLGHKKSLPWLEFRQIVDREFGVEGSQNYRDAAYTALNRYESLLHPAFVADITEQSLNTFRALLLNENRAQSTVASYLRHLRVVLNWAVNLKYIPKAPKIKIARVKGTLHGGALTPGEFGAMLRAVALVSKPEDVPAWRRLLRVLWLSGLRLAEAMRLSFDELPFRAEIHRNPPQFLIAAKGQKARRDEITPMTPDFALYLRRRTSCRGLVCPSPLKNVEDASKLISTIGERSGVVIGAGHPTAHDLRRSFGTRWALKVEAPVLQLLMRHADYQTTKTFYVRLQADRLGRELWAKFGLQSAEVNTPDPAPPAPSLRLYKQA